MPTCPMRGRKSRRPSAASARQARGQQFRVPGHSAQPQQLHAHLLVLARRRLPALPAKDRPRVGDARRQGLARFPRHIGAHDRGGMLRPQAEPPPRYQLTELRGDRLASLEQVPIARFHDRHRHRLIAIAGDEGQQIRAQLFLPELEFARCVPRHIHPAGLLVASARSPDSSAQYRPLARAR